MQCSLLLNSNFEPLCFVDVPRAIRLLTKKKVDVVDYGAGPSVWGKKLRSINNEIELPATIRLRVGIKTPRVVPRFCKSALLNRDNWTCQYCGKKLNSRSVTIDHVVPRSRGGQTTWTNCVTACTLCNTVKRDMDPEQVGLKLRKQPSAPSRLHFLRLKRDSSEWHPDWRYFIATNY